MTAVPETDYDSPWKEALERYFEAFMAFFFPHAHADIDWARGYEFLDKELQQVVREAELGRRLVDKLVKVWRRAGEEAWVLVHGEVQSQVDADFPKRMYVYNYRLFDRYDRWVVSVAVLGDDRADWRPEGYGYELWGCQAGLRFPVVKLTDYAHQRELLGSSLNPFSVVVMAHLQAQATRRDPTGRLQWKLRVVKGLYERGYQREEIVEVFRLIDWLLVLPEELEQGFKDALIQYEEETQMPYITSIERLGIQQGIQQGILQNAREDILDILETRFADVPQSIVEEINRIDDSTILKMLLKRAIAMSSVEEFEKAL